MVMKLVIMNLTHINLKRFGSRYKTTANPVNIFPIVFPVFYDESPSRLSRGGLLIHISLGRQEDGEVSQGYGTVISRL